MDIVKWSRILPTLDEKKLFRELKKVTHESANVEFKEYFKIKDDMWRLKTDEVAAYLAGLTNAGGGIVCLGVPVDKKGIFSEEKWESTSPIPIISHDRLTELLQNKLPARYFKKNKN
ncbi:MAG: hypothetical protein ACFE9L_18610 [Candidatus Hodarchaeota archaeon]